MNKRQAQRRARILKAQNRAVVAVHVGDGSWGIVRLEDIGQPLKTRPVYTMINDMPALWQIELAAAGETEN